MSESCVIFGHRGQDGTLLREILRGRSLVIGVSRDSVEYFDINGKLISSESPPDDFRLFFAELRPRHVYYLAANHRSSEVIRSSDQGAEFQRYFLENVLSYHAVLEGVRQSGIETKVVYACSSQVFAGNPSKILNEESFFAPRNFYAMAKAQGFWLGKMYRENHQMWVSSLILFNHESHLRKDGFLTSKVLNAAVRISAGSKEKLVLQYPNVLVDWGNARDFVRCFRAVTDQEVPDDFVVATGQRHSVWEFCQLVFSEFGLDASHHIEFGPEEGNHPSSLGIADTSKVKRVVGWCASGNFEDFIKELSRNWLQTRPQ